MCEFFYWSFPRCHDIVPWGVAVFLVVRVFAFFMKLMSTIEQ